MAFEELLHNMCMKNKLLYKWHWDMQRKLALNRSLYKGNLKIMTYIMCEAQQSGTKITLA